MTNSERKKVRDELVRLADGWQNAICYIVNGRRNIDAQGCVDSLYDTVNKLFPQRCSEHPTYKVLRKPRPSKKHPTGCQTCNLMWEQRETVSPDTMTGSGNTVTERVQED
jgi:hypothetical protein